MTPIAADLLQVVEAAMLKLADTECSCVGEAKCMRCVAIEALELLGQADFVAGLMEMGKGASDGEA